MRIWLAAIIFSVCALSSARAAGFGMEVGPVTMNYEPWVKTAKLGDFTIVATDNQKYRYEVTSADKNFVTVEQSLINGGPRDERVKYRYPMKEAPVVPWGENQRKVESGKQTLNGTEVSYDKWEYTTRSMQQKTKLGGKKPQSTTAFMETRCVRLVSKDIPCGGQLKLTTTTMIDGKPHVVTHETLEFGNEPPKKQRSASAQPE